MDTSKAKSGLVSIVTAACELAALSMAMVFLAGPALIAFRWMGGVVGAIANYLLNRAFAFVGGEEDRPVGQIRRFGTTALLSVSVSTTLWCVLIGCTGADPRVLHPICLMAVWMLLTYPLMKRWVFSRPS